MNFTFLSILQVIAVAVIGWSLYRTRNSRKAFSSLKAQAWELYQGAVVDSFDPKYAFDAKVARVLRVEETGGVMSPVTQGFDDYILRVFAENPHGEVFLFTYCAGSQHVKHVAEAAVSALLPNERPAL